MSLGLCAYTLAYDFLGLAGAVRHYANSNYYNFHLLLTAENTSCLAAFAAGARCSICLVAFNYSKSELYCHLGEKTALFIIIMRQLAGLNAIIITDSLNLMLELRLVR